MSSSSSKSTRLYISNLSFSTTEDELIAYLKKYGATSVLIPSQTIRGFRTKEIRPLGIGYAEFDSNDSLNEAIKDLDGKDFKGRQLKLKQYVPYSPNLVSKKMSNSRSFSKLRQVKDGASDDKNNEISFKTNIIETHCVESTGDDVTEIQARPETNTNNQSSATEVSSIDEFNHEQNYKEEFSKDTVYIGYLPKNCTDVDLRELFKTYKPQEIWIFRTKPSKPRHLRFRRHFIAAMIRLKTPEKIELVIENVNKEKLLGKKIVAKPAINRKILEMKKMAENKKKLEHSNYILLEVDETCETDDRMQQTQHPSLQQIDLPSKTIPIEKLNASTEAVVNSV